jgi:hypothetical protein
MRDYLVEHYDKADDRSYLNEMNLDLAVKAMRIEAVLFSQSVLLTLRTSESRIYS